MDFEIKTKFVDALLTCPAMRDRDTRDAIVDQLPKVRNRCKRSKIDRTDVLSILDRSLSFGGEFVHLIKVIRFYEGDSKYMLHIDDLCNKYSTDIKVKHDTVSKSEKKPAPYQSTYYHFICSILTLIFLLFLIVIYVMPPEMVRPSGIVMEIPEPIYILRIEPLIGDRIFEGECQKHLENAVRIQFEKQKLENVRLDPDCNGQSDGNKRNSLGEFYEFYNTKIVISSIYVSSNKGNNRVTRVAEMNVSINTQGSDIKYNTEPPSDNKFVDALIFMTLLALTQVEFDQGEHLNARGLIESTIKLIPEKTIIELSGTDCNLDHLLSRINGTNSSIDEFKELCLK